MNNSERESIASQVCQFYGVGLDQVWSADKSPAVIVARCAIVAELDARREPKTRIARFMRRSELACNAALQQYESRAAGAGLPLYAPTLVSDSEPEPGASDAKPEALEASSVISAIARKISLCEPDKSQPLCGLTVAQAADIARRAYIQDCVVIADIAEYFDVPLRAVSRWLAAPVGPVAAPTPPHCEEPADLPISEVHPAGPIDAVEFCSLDAESYLAGRLADEGYPIDASTLPVPPMFGAPADIIRRVLKDAEARGISRDTLAAFFQTTLARISALLRVQCTTEPKATTMHTKGPLLDAPTFGQRLNLADIPSATLDAIDQHHGIDIGQRHAPVAPGLDLADWRRSQAGTVATNGPAYTLAEIDPRDLIELLGAMLERLHTQPDNIRRPLIRIYKSMIERALTAPVRPAAE